MIHFNELRVTPDHRYLIIDAVVRNEPYFDNVYIDKIVIDNQDTYVDTGMPSSKPIYEHVIPVYTKNGKTNKQKHIRLELESIDLGRPLTDMFFVYIQTKGTPAPTTPCSLDHKTTLGTVLDMYPLYQASINMLKELSQCCEVPQDFIDFMLRIKAIELSIKTGNYIEAIGFYNHFFRPAFKHKDHYHVGPFLHNMHNLHNLPNLHIKKGGGCCCGK